MTITVQQVLDKYADGLSEQDFAAALDAQLTDRGPQGSTPLTAGEREFLIAQGVAEPDLETVAAAAELRLRADHVIDLAATSYTVGDAAVRLGVDSSRIRHRIADRSLYGLRIGARLHLPHWQFTDGEPSGPLPHLRAVLRAVPDGVSPIEMTGFMTVPQAELVLAGRAVTPRQWLLAGQRPEAICEILAGFYQW